MNRDPFENEHDLRQKFDEYHVDMPDFPMKPSKWGRLIRFLARPVKDPLEPLVAKSKSLLLLKVIPIFGALVLALIQLAVSSVP